MLDIIFEYISDFASFCFYIMVVLFKRRAIQICVLLFGLIVYILYNYYYSVKAQNRMFLDKYISTLNAKDILHNVMHSGIYGFTGDNIEATNFFLQIGWANINMFNNILYKNQIAVYQFVINDKPSNPYQLNGEYANDSKIKNAIASQSETQKELRFTTMQERKRLYLDNDFNIKAWSIYCKDGINHNTFLENVKKYNGKLNAMQVNCLDINDKTRGQIIIVKNIKTNSFFILREIAGDQAHNLHNSTHYKFLVFDNLNGMLFKTRSDIAKHDMSLYYIFNLFNIFEKIGI